MNKHETVAMPGDGDEPIDQAKAERKDGVPSGQPVKDAKDKSKTERKFDGPSAKDAAEGRGTDTPAQVEGDGWGDTPVQMRNN